MGALGDFVRRAADVLADGVNLHQRRAHVAQQALQRNSTLRARRDMVDIERKLFIAADGLDQGFKLVPLARQRAELDRHEHLQRRLHHDITGMHDDLQEVGLWCAVDAPARSLQAVEQQMMQGEEDGHGDDRPPIAVDQHQRQRDENTEVKFQRAASQLDVQRIGNSNALFCSQRPSGKALDHPLNRPLGLFAAR